MGRLEFHKLTNFFGETRNINQIKIHKRHGIHYKLSNRKGITIGRDGGTNTAIRESHTHEVGLVLVFGGRIKSGLEKRADGIPQ